MCVCMCVSVSVSMFSKNVFTSEGNHSTVEDLMYKNIWISQIEVDVLKTESKVVQ